MATAKDIIREAESLPIEERVLVADSLLRSLNPLAPKIDRKWAEAAKLRLEQLQSGKVSPVPGERVFSDIYRRFREL